MIKILKNFRMILILTFISFFSLSGQAKADWAEDYLKKLNENWKGGAPTLQSQGAYGYSGGGFSYTYENKVLQPFNAKGPSMSAGCGGINFDFGAFDFLADPERLVEFLEALLDAAPGYAFELGLQVLCPSCMDIMNTMNQIANTINGLQFDACGTMEALSGMAKDSFNQYVQSEQGKGYRSYKEATDEYVVKPLKVFNDTLAKAFDCAETFGIPESGCQKNLFTGRESLMEIVAAKMDVSIIQPILNALGDYGDVGNPKAQQRMALLMRAIIGDVGYKPPKDTKEDKDKKGKDSGLQVGDAKERVVIYSGRWSSMIQAVNYLAFGGERLSINSKNKPDKADITFTIYKPIPEKEGGESCVKAVWAKGTDSYCGEFDGAKVEYPHFVTYDKDPNTKGISHVDITPFHKLATDKLNSIYESFINRDNVTDDALAFLNMFKSPVYKAFNLYSISNEALKSFKTNFESVAGVQLTYEFFSQMNTAVLAGLDDFEQSIRKAGYLKAGDDLHNELTNFKTRLRLAVETSYKLYIEAYSQFTENMQKNNELQKMQDAQRAMFARHPVLGQKMFIHSMGK